MQTTPPYMDQLREDWLREWMPSSEDSEEREALAQHVGAILSMMVNDKFDTTEMH